MENGFYVADKEINGQKVTGYDNESGQAVVMKWDVNPWDMPNSKDGSIVVLKSAENVIVPSIWKGFSTQVTGGLNQFTNKINDFFNSIGNNNSAQPQPQQASDFDYDAPFKPTLIHTGLGVSVADNTALFLYSYEAGKDGITLAGGVQIVTGSNEVNLYVYNFLPHDISISKGRPIALGVFQRTDCGINLNLVSNAGFIGSIENNENTQPKSGVNLSKE